MMNRRELLALVAGAAPTISAGVNRRSVSTDWPHWRGPNADGIGQGRNLPLQWSRTENVRWSATLPGWGTSSPVVYGDRLFVTSQAQDGEKKSLLTLCFDRRSGKEVWRHDFGLGTEQRTHEKSNLAVNTPAVTKDAVYVAFGNSDVACYSHGGRLQWVTRYMELFGDPKMAWGHGSVRSFCTTPWCCLGTITRDPVISSVSTSEVC